MNEQPKSAASLSPSPMENFVLNRQKRRTEQMKAQMQYFQQKFNEQKHNFSNAELTYVITHLTPNFNESEKRKLEDLRRKFTRNNLYCCLFSGVNVFLVAAYFKSFLSFSSFKKILFGVGVYLGSYELGMYKVKNSLKIYHNDLLDKYKNEFVNTKFNESN